MLPQSESSMEFVGHRGSSGASELLVVPAPSFLDIDFDLDDDDGDLVIGIRPKSSPQPRRKSSVSDEDSEPEPPSLSGSRRVSFADAVGLSLVQVKEFDKWDVPQLPDFLNSKSREEEEYYIAPFNFCLSLSPEELLAKVQEQKVELETIELLPGTTILKGVIRVLNISFTKAVYVRTTLDNWNSHFDLLSEYIPGSSDGQTDSFSFKLTLVPPFGEQGLRVDFCLRYETPVGTFWGNNDERNFVLFCHKRKKDLQEKLQKENSNKKSCLKTVSQSFSAVESMSCLEQESVTKDVTQHGAKVSNENQNQSTNSPSGNSEEEGHTLQVENKRNRSRRNRRKAARMARVRDYFAQKDVKSNDSESEALPNTQTETSQEENQAEKYSDAQTLSKGNIKSEGTVIPADAPLSNDSASKSKTEKCENINLADVATLTTTADSPDDSKGLSNAESAPAQHQNINRSVPTAEERSQEPVGSYECTDPSGENVGSESLVSNSSSYAFGTVVAPLYHQVSGRAGSQSDTGNPLWAALSHPHTESHNSVSTSNHQDRDQRETSHTQENNHNCTDTALCSSTVTAKVENTLSVTTFEIVETLVDPNELENTDQIVRNATQSNTISDLLDNLNSESLNAQEMSSNLKEETHDGDLTFDLQITLAHDAAQTQLQENTSSDACIKMNMDETVLETEAQESTFDLENSSQLCQNETLCLAEQPTNTSDVTAELSQEHDDNTVALLTTQVSSKEESSLSFKITHQPDNSNDHIDELGLEHDDKTLAILTNQEEIASSLTSYNTSVSLSEQLSNTSDLVDELKPEHAFSKTVDISPNHASSEEGKLNTHNELEEKENMPSPASCLETLTKMESSLETGEMRSNSKKSEEKQAAEMEGVGEQSVTKAEPKNCHVQSDVFIMQKDEMLKDEEITVSGKVEQCDMEKNWEVMVKEEEMSIDEFILQTENEEEVEVNLNEVEDDTLEGFDSEMRLEVTDKAEMAVESNKDEAKDTVEDNMREDTFDEVFINTVQEQNVHFEEILENKMQSKHTDDEENVEDKNTRAQEISDEICIIVNETESDDVKCFESKTLDNEDLPGFESSDITASEKIKMELNRDEEECLSERLDITPHEAECKLSAPVNNVKEGKGELDMVHCKEEDFHNIKTETSDRLESVSDVNESTFEEVGLCTSTDDRISDNDSASESGSEDEMELYMHCLRAVYGQQGSSQATKPDQSKEFNGAKRLSITRSKLLSTPMPSISESADEEQQFSSQEKDFETVDVQETAAALSAPSSKEENISRNYLWWKQTFSCSNILKTLLYTTLLVIFLAVAYHYDFIACFGLYLISLVWLCCQGDRQHGKNNRLS